MNTQIKSRIQIDTSGTGFSYDLRSFHYSSKLYNPVRYLFYKNHFYEPYSEALIDKLIWDGICKRVETSEPNKFTYKFLPDHLKHYNFTNYGNGIVPNNMNMGTFFMNLQNILGTPKYNGLTIYTHSMVKYELDHQVVSFLYGDLGYNLQTRSMVLQLLNRLVYDGLLKKIKRQKYTYYRINSKLFPEFKRFDPMIGIVAIFNLYLLGFMELYPGCEYKRSIK